MIVRAWVGLGQAHIDFAPRHFLKEFCMARHHFVFLILCKRLAWCIRAVCSLLYLNPARFLFPKRNPPLAFAAHSILKNPPRKKSEWRGAARREGGTRGTPRVAGFREPPRTRSVRS